MEFSISLKTERWWNEVHFVIGRVIQGFIIFSTKWLTSMLVKACHIKLGSKNSTYCVPNSNTGGWKCKGLPFSREYGEELVERRKSQEKKKKNKAKAQSMNFISFTKNLKHEKKEKHLKTRTLCSLSNRACEFTGINLQSQLLLPQAASQTTCFPAWQRIMLAQKLDN